MTILACPLPGCGFQTADVDVIGAAAILNIHSHAHANPTLAAIAPQPKNAPKLIRPRIQHNATGEDWNAFIRRWDTFQIGSGIQDATAPGQLLECASEQLGNVVLRAHPNFTTKNLHEAIATLKSIAVIPVALGVLRSDLASMQQHGDEPFRTFAARVQGKAETCEFKTTYDGTCMHCNNTYNGEVYYTDEVIRDVLLNGVADIDIRREALSTEGIQIKPITEIIAFIETRETARNANPSSAVSALSEYRKSTRGPKQQHPKARPASPTHFDQSKTASCPDCSSTFRLYTKKARGWNRRPHSRCEDCWKKIRETSQQTSTHGSITHSTEDSIGQIGSIQRTINVTNGTKPRNLDHQIFTKGAWRKTRVTQQPSVTLNLTADNYPSCPIKIRAIVDSGAQSDLWSLEAFLNAGFCRSDLHPVSLSINAANKSPIRIDGAFFGTLEGESAGTNQVISHKSMVYVSRDANAMYLSYDSMLGLGILSHEFPQIGRFLPQVDHQPDNSLPSLDNISTCNVSSIDLVRCDCRKRTPVPPRPTALPFHCSEDNIVKMREWLLEYFGSFTFNICPHQHLPTMSGPPVEIHLKEETEPTARHKAIPIPLHWQEQVHNDLLRDEALGVIERVPIGEPVEWCHRMVVTRKHDGSPRRTVDLSPLNKHCKRETHNSEAPFHIVRRVPRRTWKTVTDAWNGYHSVQLRESDRHLTTFVTPFGRWRYKRAPQGFLSSGDGYNRRFDAILADFTQKERLVDDTLLHDTDLEKHWWRTIDFLSTVGNAGIVLNPTKFQFSSREVDFAGFHITEDRINPLPKFYSAIQDFPTPKSTTDIRSWFGLVNQVANYAQLREHMEHFRPFLSPRHPFHWTPELDQSFQSSKTAIIKAIHHGVEIFDVNRPTCLRTDWSKKGIGYFLLQKHCKCEELSPGCCENGWLITLAGSRFLDSAEQHYAPVEGEALAITWGLEQTKYFTMGCQKLVVATDHKPLLKIFGDRTLDEIPNTRLFRLKQRILPWYFDIIHLPGKTNLACDATSRYPSASHEKTGLSKEHMLESVIAAAIQFDTQKLTSITWDQLVIETTKDNNLVVLIEAIQNGFPDVYRTNASTSPYWQYRQNLHITDGVIIYNDRVVVPPTLRRVVLDTLHSAHQGVSTMSLRARLIVFWPGMTNDIEQHRRSCMVCVKNAPSQPPVPTSPASPPATPFEQTFADFFECFGQHYLVIGDRLSGWSDVFQSPKGTPQAGSEGLITCLRNFFSRFGVPDELASDGGPEFIASSTQDFLKRWGVGHRVSSAYHPQSNGRAEVAVKSAKRLLRSNTGSSGTLDTDRFLRAIMQLRNTPDPDCNLSPAQILFGHPIRDAFAFINRLDKFSNENIHPLWRDAWRHREEALRTRFHHAAEERNEHTRFLPALHVGDHCYMQNQTGNHPRRWDRSGVIVECNGHDSYTLKVDGTGRVTKRNRRFLRSFQPASTRIPYPPLVTRCTPTIPKDDGTSSPTSTEYAPSPSMPSKPSVTEPMAPPPQSTSERNDFQPIVIGSDDGEMQHNIVNVQTSSPVERPTRVRKAPKRYVPESGEWE